MERCLPAAQRLVDACARAEEAVALGHAEGAPVAAAEREDGLKLHGEERGRGEGLGGGGGPRAALGQREVGFGGEQVGGEFGLDGGGLEEGDAFA